MGKGKAASVALVKKQQGSVKISVVVLVNSEVAQGSVCCGGGVAGRSGVSCVCIGLASQSFVCDIEGVGGGGAQWRGAQGDRCGV